MQPTQGHLCSCCMPAAPLPVVQACTYIHGVHLQLVQVVYLFSCRNNAVKIANVHSIKLVHFATFIVCMFGGDRSSRIQVSGM